MRIGIDGYNLAMPRGTGIATYGAELIAALHDSGHAVDGIFGLAVPREMRLRQSVFFDQYRRPADPPRRIRRWLRPWHRARADLRALSPHSMREVPLDAAVVLPPQGLVTMPRFDRVFTAPRLFDDAARVFALTGRFTTIRVPDPPKIMHWTYPLPLRLAGARNVYTVHDLVPLKLPYTTLDVKASYGRLIQQCLRHGDAICTVSQSSRDDIMRQFNVQAERIHVTYQTATLFRNEAGDTRDDIIGSVFGFKRRGYFLFFGSIEPKKNISRLIEAYLMLRSETPLVLVGARAWRSEAELQLMPEGGADAAAGTFHGPAGQTIVRIDYLPAAMLAKLVAGAKAVVFPSLYEGFGLPVLEAMQLGTPVIASDTSSLPEVAGDAGLLVNPYDVDALMRAMRSVDDDPVLAAAMGSRGLTQALTFGADRYRERLDRLYAAALRG